MKNVILDTNFMLIPFYFGVDIFSEIDRICPFAYRLVMLSPSIRELEEIETNQRGKSKKAAAMARALLNAKPVTIQETDEGHVDDIIVKTARPGSDIVATQDKGLRKRLREHGVARIVLRQKKYLQLIE